MLDSYPPFRDKLRAMALWPGLMTVFAYSQYLQREMDLLPQLMTPSLRAADEPWQAGLFPWAVELLARELILNGRLRDGTKLTDGASVFEMLEMIRVLEDEAWKQHDASEDDVLLEMSRVAYRQFPWQAGITTEDLARYYLMFSEPQLAASIESEFGLTVIELFQVILLMKHEMTQQPMLQMAFSRIAAPSILPALNALASRLGKPVDEMREALAGAQRYDVNWAYTFNPLREFPLVHMGNEQSMLCPIPYLLIRRLTDGIYYDLIRRGDNAVSLFGEAFEAYVGRASRKALDDRCTVLSDKIYGSPQKRSIDWIVEDDSATLFIECKLARPDLKAQTLITDGDPFAAALKRLRDAIVQAYATLSDALGGQYPHWRSDGRPLYPVIVTLAEWYAFGPLVGRTLQAHVDAGFAKRGLDRALLERFPFTVCSAAEYEGLLAVLRTVPINDVLAEKVDAEHKEWMLGPYLNRHFAVQAEREAALFEQAMLDMIHSPSRITRGSQAPN